MKLGEVMARLEELGDEQTRKTHRRHGATGNFFGVKVGDLKPLARKLRGEQALALELYATGNGDAMYLAGLVADGARMTRNQLDAWLATAPWAMISEFTVPWVAAESPHARELALKWMDSKKDHFAVAGWNTYSSFVWVRPDAELDLKEIERLLSRVEQEIGSAPNRVRYCMNGFVIAVGGAVKPLSAKAKAAAKRIGAVEFDSGDTACKLPPALATIQKLEQKGRIGAKRKSTKC